MREAHRLSVNVPIIIITSSIFVRILAYFWLGSGKQKYSLTVKEEY